MVSARIIFTQAMSWLLASVAIVQPAMAQVFPTFDVGHDNRLGLTFTPDGSTAFWVEWNGAWGSNTTSRRVIYMSRRQDNVWGEAIAAPLSQEFSNDDPFVSPDGQWLYFVSERPADDNDNNADADIWRYSLVDDHKLERLPINSDAAEYSPVVAASGALYFASARDGETGNGDLYRAAPSGNGFTEPERLGNAINSSTGEWNLWVSADETEILFEASSRPSNVSVPGDLYYSWRTQAGWTSAIPVAKLNTGDSDLMPRLHPDGETLYYATAPIGGQARIVSAQWGPLRAELRAGYAPILLVANRSSHEVTILDLARGEVVARVATGQGPHLLSNVSDGRVLATGYGEFPEPHAEPVSSRPPFVEALNSRMTLIDTARQTAIMDVVIEDCVKPHASWIVDQQAYLTCEKERRVAVIDLETGRTTDRFDTMQEGSHVLSFEPVSRTLATSNTDSGSVTLINVVNGESQVVKLAAGSEGALAIEGRIWIGNAIDGSVSIVDPRTASVVRQIDSVCSFPIAFSPDAQEAVWLACFASGELVAIDRDNFSIGRRIKLRDLPLNLVTHPQRGLAYVSFPRRNAIAEIDLDTGAELRSIAVGIEPDGLRWAVSERP